MTFKNAGTTLGTGSVSGGIATYTTTSLTSGSHTFTAEFASSNTSAYTNSASSGLSYTVTTSGGGGGSSATNASATPYVALGSGQPLTAVRSAVNDTNYTATAKDTIIAYTALSAARTVTLPAPSTVPRGWQCIVKDESGSCSASNTITLTGTIDGTTNLTLNTAYVSAVVYNNGTSWSRIS